ncbi:hypothetical protein [Paenirhodobacter populi]|uniref:hypothetical protein n=1 Tax=Paenirhodobacter populi TaxID=2306993 RepID=UPI0013E3C444|nr:hypothetical protein [Sinirhodobacter populi]
MNALVQTDLACPIYPNHAGPKMKYVITQFSGTNNAGVSPEVASIMFQTDIKMFVRRWGQFPLIQIDADRVAAAACGYAVVSVRAPACKAKPDAVHSTIMWLSALRRLDQTLRGR